jgi:NitT/TauT family transport system ATP-binding protein
MDAPVAKPAEPGSPDRGATADESLPSIVEFKKVTKTYYPGTPRAFTAIRDVTFVVKDLPKVGEFVAMLGPSGCGKSTVLKLIAGLEPQFPATSGETLLWGKPIEGPGADRGMVFQEYTAFDHRTVLDNVAFGLECRGVSRREREDKAMHWIQKVGLDAKKDARKYPHQLSGGMRQRVAIARTLILEPRIVLMDEPFGALDPMTRLRMQDQIIGLWKDVQATVFFVTHSIEEAVFLGDRVYLFSGAPGTILEEMRLPRPDRPAIVAQAEPEFTEVVKGLREKISRMEEGKD